MKAGLMTFYYAHHYGAQLQAYALMKSVEKQGVTCEIIDYVRKDTLEGSGIFSKGIAPKTILKNLYNLIQYPTRKRRSDRFHAFVDKYMKLSDRSYRSAEALFDNPPDYDCYLCGSDQIWNPVIYTEKDFDKAFMLAFTEKRKIAYAPSFGISSIPDDKNAPLKQYLGSFDSLSVREHKGADIIRDLTGLDVPVVLDPTLLLDENEWSEAASTRAIDEPYLLCYFVTDARPFFGQLEQLAKESGLKPYWLSGNRHAPKGFRKVQDAGPEEFLSLIKNASMVCTNSFHGTVFSILFKRDFYCFSNLYQYKEVSHGTNTLNSRVGTLLSNLGLGDRFIAQAQKKSDSAVLNAANPIDYDSVDALLDKERQASLAFLSEAINTPTTMK